jgi:hypothetical protein
MSGYVGEAKEEDILEEVNIAEFIWLYQRWMKIMTGGIRKGSWVQNVKDAIPGSQVWSWFIPIGFFYLVFSNTKSFLIRN